MSHSFHGPRGTTFHFNSDFSGDVAVLAPDESAVQVPAEDLLAFAALIVARQAEQEIEGQ